MHPHPHPHHTTPSCSISFADQALTLRSPGGAVEKPREEVVPFSIGAAPPAAASARQAAGAGEEGGEKGVGGVVMVEEEGLPVVGAAEGAGESEGGDDEPLGNLPPSRGGVSMAGF